MKYGLLFILLVFIMGVITAQNQNSKVGADMETTTFYKFEIKDIEGKPLKMEKYRNKVILVVNVASKCGYTRQYAGLQKLYEKYKERGLVILGFPCNDFGNQEPGTNEEIKQFCSTNFGVTFPMMDKIKVLGPEKHPLYAWLTNNNVTGKEDIRWNFEKFLIDKQGNIVKRFKSSVKPDDQELIKAIEELLGNS